MIKAHGDQFHGQEYVYASVTFHGRLSVSESSTDRSRSALKMITDEDDTFQLRDVTLPLTEGDVQHICVPASQI